MPEPLTAEYLRETQRIVSAAPKGPWDIEPTDDGRLPDQVGPICFLETWSDAQRIPVVELIAHAREALPRYVGEVSRQRAEISVLKRRVQQLERAEGGDRRGQ